MDVSDRTKNHHLKLLVLLAFVGVGVVMTGASAESSFKDINRFFRDITISSGETMADLSSVNGNIELQQGAVAGEVTTVNGTVRIKDDVAIKSVHSVNGAVYVGSDVRVTASITTVNGDIRVESGVEIGESLESVNGTIAISSSRIGRAIETINGDISIIKGSVVEADIVFQESPWPDGYFSNKPILRIDGTSIVKGTIHLHREVVLDFDDETLLSQVVRHY